MTLPLDHIVIAVQDLERTIADYTALGFNVLRGGEHPGRSTHNALVVFADGAYFELIAWRAPAPEERWWQQLQRHGEGIVDFALLPTETGAVVAAARARGLDYEAPYEGGRLRPDGAQLRWRNARARSQDLPFLWRRPHAARPAVCPKGRRACTPTAPPAWPGCTWPCMTCAPAWHAGARCWARAPTLARPGCRTTAAPTAHR